ncbi:MAG: lipopolysaccharide kinase InaA family protein [Alloalcanivorax xenomutans]
MAMRWWVKSAPDQHAFDGLDAVFQLQGQVVSDGPMGDVVRLRRGERTFFVKRYRNGGGHLHNWIGTPRVQREWRNLDLFRRWGLPVPDVVGAGFRRRRGRFHQGALITVGIPDSTDLATLARSGAGCLRDRAWVAAVSDQVADGLRVMHARGFCHGDMKWRNILVTGTPPRVFFIDCPAGRFWFGPFLRYRVIKDLACLDKVAKHTLRRTQRLRFYLRYTGRSRLNDADRRRIRKVLRFFQGRE